MSKFCGIYHDKHAAFRWIGKCIDLGMSYCQNGLVCVKILTPFFTVQGRGARAAHQTLNLLILVRIQAPLPERIKMKETHGLVLQHFVV